MQNTKAYIMLVCATLFWAGNFNIGKLAYLENTKHGSRGKLSISALGDDAKPSVGFAPRRQ